MTSLGLLTGEQLRTLRLNVRPPVVRNKFCKTLRQKLQSFYDFATEVTPPRFICYIGPAQIHPGAGVGRGIQQCEYQRHFPLVHREVILNTNYNVCFITRSTIMTGIGRKGKSPTDHFLKNVLISPQFTVA